MSDRASRRRMSRFIDDEAQVSGSEEWSYGDDDDGISAHQSDEDFIANEDEAGEISGQSAEH